MINSEIISAYVGSDQVERLYLGSDIVWEMTQPTPPEPVGPLPPVAHGDNVPLSFLMLQDGYVGLRCLSGISATQSSASLGSSKSLDYKIYGPGHYWGNEDEEFDEESVTSSGTLTITNQSHGQTELVFVPSGHTICFFGPNNSQGGLISYTGSSRLQVTQSLTFDGFYVSGSPYQTALVYGNIMSIVMTELYFEQIYPYEHTSLLSDVDMNAYTFNGLFYDESVRTGQPRSGIMFPSNIEDTLIIPGGHGETLTSGCTNMMFMGCENLTKAPALPATTLAPNCYGLMFSCCKNLTTAPALPATTLAPNCYTWMFEQCTGLTQAPALPATTLTNSCYNHMFYGCTSLTTAPELPATTLTGSCYNNMFAGCTSLNYVKCLATSGSGTTNWLSGVSSTGTFVKHPNKTWSTGTGGIPEGWTVQDAVI